MLKNVKIFTTILLVSALILLSCEITEDDQTKEIQIERLPAREYGLGNNPLPPAEYKKYLKILPVSRAALPIAYDARNDGIVTPAKSQGGCGSCWAFASVGALESHLIKKYPTIFNNTLHLSEQQQVSCNTLMDGCDGGTMTALRFYEKWSFFEAHGPAEDECFDYTGTKSTCGLCADYTHSIVYDYRVTNYYTIDNFPELNLAQVRASLYAKGPSWFEFNVHNDFFDFWDLGLPGDVYVNQEDDFIGGHAVLVIGWDDTLGAYLCKNSWGENGGPNNDGTFWIAYTGHANNLCFGMANFDVTLPCDPRPCVTNTCVECSNGTCQ